MDLPGEGNRSDPSFPSPGRWRSMSPPGEAEAEAAAAAVAGDGDAPAAAEPAWRDGSEGEGV